MCGIAGIADFSGTQPDKETIRRMTRILAHRGPDHEGIFCEGAVGLGHRRLAILDLTPAAHQPMASPDGTLRIIFNGEIYNFKTLRVELEQHGYIFLTNSDTEVLLAGYQIWGDECWRRLDGFFAIALWDARKRQLRLVRDALGIKPLFYSVRGEKLIFGSELKALLISGLVPRAIEPQALSNYFSLFYTPGPDSIIKGVHHVEPGEFMIFEKGGMTKKKHWKLQIPPALKTNSVEAVAEAVREECRIAVRGSLESDVPVGLLLSGGLDSNIILYELAQLGQTNVRTVTVGFREKSFDEATAATESRDYFGISGQTIFVEDHDAAKIFDKMVYHCDTLNANVANLAEYQIFRAASQQFRVGLAGMGNDELFAGYSTYLADRLRPWYRTCVPPPLRRLIRLGARHLPASGRKYGIDWMARKFTEGVELDPLQAHFWWRTVFSPEEKKQLFSRDFLAMVNPDAYPIYDRHYRSLPEATQEQKILYADLQAFCIDNANILMDGLSMAFSVEVRPPFLSKRFVEFAFSIPDSMKIRGTSTKDILRHSYSRRLPKKIIRTRKTGLVSPLALLIRGQLRKITLETFAENAEHPLFRRGQCHRYLNEHLKGEKDHGLPIYLLLNFFRWQKIFMTNI